MKAGLTFAASILHGKPLSLGFAEQGNHPCQKSDDQREGAQVEQVFGAHQVVQLESHAHQQANQAEDHKGE